MNGLFVVVWFPYKHVVKFFGHVIPSGVPISNHHII